MKAAGVCIGRPVLLSSRAGRQQVSVSSSLLSISVDVIREKTDTEPESPQEEEEDLRHISDH